MLDRLGFFGELTTMIGGGIYPGMVTATIGTFALLAVVATSIVIVKRRLRYEWWYAVHLLAYAGIALAWFHQIPTGNELVLDEAAADYWRSLYLVTLALLVAYRLAAPAIAFFRHGLRVAAVREEGPGVVSLEISGRNLQRLRARPGQFFLWRFLSPGRWWKAHPFSLSAAPGKRRLRVTIKNLGDFTSTRRRHPGRDARPRRGAVRHVHGRRGPAPEDTARRRGDRDHGDPRTPRRAGRRRDRRLPRRRRGRGDLPRRAAAARHRPSTSSRATTASRDTPS